MKKLFVINLMIITVIAGSGLAQAMSCGGGGGGQMTGAVAPMADPGAMAGGGPGPMLNIPNSGDHQGMIPGSHDQIGPGGKKKPNIQRNSNHGASHESNISGIGH